jgi:hypothetical protein
MGIVFIKIVVELLWTKNAFRGLKDQFWIKELNS